MDYNFFEISGKEKKKNNKNTSVVLIVIVVLVFAGLGGLTAWNLMETNRIKAEMAEATEKIEVNKKKAAELEKKEAQANNIAQTAKFFAALDIAVVNSRTVNTKVLDYINDVRPKGFVWTDGTVMAFSMSSGEMPVRYKSPEDGKPLRHKLAESDQPMQFTLIPEEQSMLGLSSISVNNKLVTLTGKALIYESIPLFQENLRALKTKDKDGNDTNINAFTDIEIHRIGESLTSTSDEQAFDFEMTLNINFIFKADASVIDDGSTPVTFNYDNEGVIVQ